MTTAKSVMSCSIDALNLSARSRNCLAGAGIKTILDLVIQTEVSLLKIDGLGKKSLREIKSAMDFANLSLHTKLPENKPVTRLVYDDSAYVTTFVEPDDSVCVRLNITLNTTNGDIQVRRSNINEANLSLYFDEDTGELISSRKITLGQI